VSVICLQEVEKTELKILKNEHESLIKKTLNNKSKGGTAAVPELDEGYIFLIKKLFIFSDVSFC